MVKSTYLSEKSSNFDETWYTASDMNPMTASWPKIEIFIIQDGGGRHLENRVFGHNSSTDCPISAKFCMRKQNGMSTRARWQKLKIFKIQDGRRPPFWKLLNRHISMKIRPILMKFGILQHILNPMTVTWPKIEFLKIQDVRFQWHFVWESRTAGRQGLHEKNCKFLKSKMADGRHLDNG